MSAAIPGKSYGYVKAGDAICVHPIDAMRRPDLFEPLDPIPDVVWPEQEVNPVDAAEEIKDPATLEEMISVMGKQATKLEFPEDMPEPEPKQTVAVDDATIAAIAAYFQEEEIEPAEVTEKPPEPTVKPVKPPTKRKVVRRLKQ